MARVDAPETELSGSAPGTRSPLRLAFVLPVGVFAIVVAFFGYGLTMDPSRIPSVLIGKSVPEFSLPPVAGRTLGLSSEDLRSEVSLVNVFASWCAECWREHPLLMQLREDDVVPLHGLNYKDKPEDARGWLDGLGDPYTRTGVDLNGRVAIDFGVYGVPETFVVDREGRIAYKHIGALDPEILKTKILPLVRRLREAAP